MKWFPSLFSLSPPASFLSHSLFPLECDGSIHMTKYPHLSSLVYYRSEEKCEPAVLVHIALKTPLWKQLSPTPQLISKIKRKNRELYPKYFTNSFLEFVPIILILVVSLRFMSICKKRVPLLGETIAAYPYNFLLKCKIQYKQTRLLKVPGQRIINGKQF